MTLGNRVYTLVNENLLETCHSQGMCNVHKLPAKRLASLQSEFDLPGTITHIGCMS